MDGSNIQYTKRMKANQVKYLEPGTIVCLHDEATGTSIKYTLVQFGNKKRLQSVKRPGIHISITDLPGIYYSVEG